MTIKVYPSLLPGLPIETHEAGNTTIGAWMQSKGADYLGRDVQPVAAFINGAEIPAAEWATAYFTTVDVVEIKYIANGGVFKALGSILGKVFNLAFGWMMPKARSQSSYNQAQGERLEASQATANTAKLGQVVPELAGRFRRFPDYLTPPRRYFVDRREQWLEFLCCVGPGTYQIRADDVKIGNTAFSALGPEAMYEILAPGANVAGKPGHEHWYTADEVGGTSSGTAGLELNAEFSSEVDPEPDSYSVAGRVLTLNGADVPQGWGFGTMMVIRVARDYVVTHDQLPTFPESSDINRFTGDFRDLMLYRGMALDLEHEGIIYETEIRAYSVDASGYGWVQLDERDGGWFNELQSGTYSLVFRPPERRYRVIAIGGPNLVEVAASEDGLDIVGWPGFTPQVGRTEISVDPATISGGWTGPYLACPAGETTGAFEVDFFFSKGLGSLTDKGQLRSWSVGIEIQYRDARVGGSFSSISRTYSDATLDQVGFTERIDLAGMITPEVRVRRIGAQSTDTKISDTVEWYGMRSRLSTRDSYPDWTTMSIKIRSGGRLGAQSENQVNVVATRILPSLQADGSWSEPGPIRDISAFVRYVASTIGYTDAEIDMDELKRLHVIWQARGETFDHVCDEATVKETLNLALGAGMAEFTVYDGRIVAVRDGPRTQFEQAYSPQNMTGPLTRAFRAPRVDDFDGVEVEYTDEKTWTKETVQCLLPGDQGFKLEKIALKGVTDRTRAWRIGMRRRRELRYRRWDYSFSTEMDALNSRYLSYVPLIDGDPGYGRSAILEHIEADGGAALLHLSEPMDWKEGAEHVVAYRRPDGTLAGPFAARAGDDDYAVLADIPQPWPVVTLSQEPPHVYFGTMDRWCFPALVTSIRPNGADTVAVEAQNYDGRVYDSDNAAPPN